MSLASARRPAALAATLATLVVATLGAMTSAHAAYEDPTVSLPRHHSPYAGIGPYRPYITEIMINDVVPLKDEAIINRTTQGYLYRAGQQNSDLTVTQTDGRLRFVDTGTKSWKWLPKACTRLTVPQGVGATCAIATKFTDAAPMLIDVWPRLGHDVVDTTALSALFDVTVLGDRGDDVVRFGAGDDFFNGAQDTDRGYGGAGRDWIRMGPGNDYIDGGAEGDYLVGVDGNDTIHSGDGDDRVSCGTGSDDATVSTSDRASDCERTSGS